MKKGLLLVYNPHNLLEFVWYYCSEKDARNMEWDALCLPSGLNGEYMSPYCRESGMFANVFSDTKTYDNMSLAGQMGMFAKMFGNFLIARQHKYAEKILRTYVDLDAYDTIVVLSDYGMVSGLALCLKNKNLVMLEDGTGDYKERSKKRILSHLTDFNQWKGYLMSTMGYLNPAFYYPLRTTKKCLKYCSHPEMMTYRDYKEIRPLFDFSKTDVALYNEILERLYPEVSKYDFSSADTVFFTSNMADFIHETEEYKEKMEKYFSGYTKNIIIKKHPRDEMKYIFPEGVTVSEIDQRIPAEVLLPYMKGKKIVFASASSVMLYMNSDDYAPECLYFNGLCEKAKKESTHAFYPEKDRMIALTEFYGVKNCKMVEL